MKAEVGDRIVVEAEPEPPRLRLRWDDGHRTVFAPTAGAAKIAKR